MGARRAGPASPQGATGPQMLLRAAVSVRGYLAPAALFDEQRRLVAASRRWEELMGLADLDYVGKRIEECVERPSPSLLEMHRRAAAGENLLSEEEAYDGPDGSTRWLSC